MIHFDTDCNAPCCPGQIVNADGQSILVQIDWDYPGTASTFGWDIRTVQRCPHCGGAPDSADGAHGECDDCDQLFPLCDHDDTDGTVDCGCGVTAGQFIEAAAEFLDGADGATADDPGYFD